MHKTFNMSVFQGNKNTTLKSLKIFFRPYLRIAASGIDRSREDLSGYCCQLLLLVSSYSYIEPVRSCCNFRLIHLLWSIDLRRLWFRSLLSGNVLFLILTHFPQSHSPKCGAYSLVNQVLNCFFFPLKFDFLVLGGRPHHTRV